jgi:hypothetical protein
MNNLNQNKRVMKRKKKIIMLKRRFKNITMKRRNKLIIMKTRCKKTMKIKMIIINQTNKKYLSKRTIIMKKVIISNKKCLMIKIK